MPRARRRRQRSMMLQPCRAPPAHHRSKTAQSAAVLLDAAHAVDSRQRAHAAGYRLFIVLAAIFSGVACPASAMVASEPLVPNIIVVHPGLHCWSAVSSWPILLKRWAIPWVNP